MTNGGFGGSLKACYSSGNQRLCEDRARITAPLMDLHPFPPLSASQTFSHYFQQLLSSRHPERHDKKSVFFYLSFFFPIDCLSLFNVHSSGWLKFFYRRRKSARTPTGLKDAVWQTAAVIHIKVALSAPARQERRSDVASRTQRE